MFEQEVDTAVAIARTVGKTILSHYAAGVVTEEKFGVDNLSEPVTVADRDASRIIVTGLASAFPGDAILSEEEVDDTERRLSKRRVWIIDPIDGTAGFIRKDGDFAVQIGLAVDGVPVVGVVYQPFHDVMHYASRGNGAFSVRQGGTPERLNTSSHKDFSEMTLAISRNHPSQRMSRIIGHFGFGHVINRGSVGLKAGLIADRSCDIYIHPGPRTKLWDTCGPQVILEEAGGRFTDLFGRDLLYDREGLQNWNGILATNGPAHDAVVEHLKPLLKEFGRTPR